MRAKSEKLVVPLMLLVMGIVACEDPDEFRPPRGDTNDTYVNHPGVITVTPDMWVGTDGLGRVIPTADNPVYAQPPGLSLPNYVTNYGNRTNTAKNSDNPQNNPNVGGRRRQVGMFYWPNHYTHLSRPDVLNIQKTLDSGVSVSDFDDPAWGGYRDTATGVVHGVLKSAWWNEPLYGYYTEYDNWVIRRHAELLADAGVDVIIFDLTNTGPDMDHFTFRNGRNEIFKVFDEAQKDGVNVPKIAFMVGLDDSCDNANAQSMKQVLYNEIYAAKKYQNLWYYWNGKPLLMSTSEGLTGDAASFFTFRQGQALYIQRFDDVTRYWDWASLFPQRVSSGNYANEQITVSVAQNWAYKNQNDRGAMTAMSGGEGLNVQGRDFYRTSQTGNGGGTFPGGDYIKHGTNFAQQWDYAIRIDPDFVFVTGWNEWNAARHKDWPGTGYAGGGYNVVNAFPDQFNDRYSRDIEPTTGDLKDHFYNQLVSFIRIYKGMETLPPATAAKTIDVNGETSQWNDVGPLYTSHKGNTGSRSAAGVGSNYYTNTTGRNDIVAAKVARDAGYIYFMVRTDGNITARGSNWMQLLISTAGRTGSHWEGYQYRVDFTTAAAARLFSAGAPDSWNWSVANNSLAYKVTGKTLVVAIPRTALGLAGSGSHFLDFKWTDNTLIVSGSAPDALNFYQYGDSAPGARFNYRYKWTD